MRGLAAGALLLGVVTGCSGTHQSSAPPATATVTVLRPDQTTVSGTVTAATALGVLGSPLALPLTITVPNRGQGEAHIVGVAVDGRRGTVAWDGGQPLPLSGTGGVDLGQATVDADAGGLTWHLDGAARALLPGRYTAGSTVAVGSTGLARPVDQATFVVAAGTRGQILTAGDAQVHLAAQKLSLTGPGRVTLTGAMTVTNASGSHPARRVGLASGAFELALTPSAGGYTVTALLQGPVTSS